MRKNRYFYTLSTFYTKLKSHTNRKSDIICSFAPHNVCQSLAKQKKSKKTTPLRLTMSAKVFQNQKNKKKPKKKQKKQKNTKKHTPTPRSSPSHGFVFFLVFSRFLLLLVESLKKTKKKTKKKTPQPPRSSPSHGFVFFCFFWFSRGFCYFWWKASKNKSSSIFLLSHPQFSASTATL